MQIPPEISYRNLEPTDATERRILKGIERLEKVCDHIMTCRVMVELPNARRRTGNLYRLRIDLTVAGGELVVKRNPPEHRSHEELVQAIGEAFDTARRKLVEVCRRQRAEVKVHEAAPSGRVSSLFPDHGFIEASEGREIYFHRHSVLDGGFDRLEVGAPVRFAEELGENGPQASTVVPLVHGHRRLRPSESIAESVEPGTLEEVGEG
ncbi:MAG: HPF/RaiA family ribosome-associated protein [Gemmatimonadetes bacterium]|nr:HPF/RaiA family ribosome-associated protein [Gemmatimonadota bacterium]